MCHTPTNSHTEMIEAAGWRVNEPNRKTVVFEAEWDGVGDVPPAEKLIKNNREECPELVKKAVLKHYTALRDVLVGKGDWRRFADFEKDSDVWARLTSLPAGVVFPEKISGSLYLPSLSSLPAGVVFPAKISGSLDLSRLTSLPEGVVFPEKIGGYLDLSRLTSLPADVKFPKECGYLDMPNNLKAQLNRKN